MIALIIGSLFAGGVVGFLVRGAVNQAGLHGMYRRGVEDALREGKSIHRSMRRRLRRKRSGKL
jgi:hypothetical protein